MRGRLTRIPYIFLFQAVTESTRVKQLVSKSADTAVKNNFVTGNTVTGDNLMLINPDHLAFVLWPYKAAKELKQQSLCRLFARLRHFLLRITLQAAGKPRNRLFIWIHECHQTE